jgi:serine/threonine protein kinase
MHKKLEHPNIVRLINYYFEKERNVTYMVLEYADGGSLFEKIKGSIMTKAFIRRIFQQVCSAILTLHKNNVMHRDIKVMWRPLSQKISCSPKRATPNCATSASLQYWASVKLSAARTSIWHQK